MHTFNCRKTGILSAASNKLMRRDTVKKVIPVILALLVVLCIGAALAAGTDSIKIKDGSTELTLRIKDYGFDNDGKTSYRVVVDGFNILLSGKVGSIEENMPFDVAIAWSREDYIRHTSYVVTMEPVTEGIFEREDESVLEDPLYIMIAPKGTAINEGYYYVIAEKKFYPAEEMGFGETDEAGETEPGGATGSDAESFTVHVATSQCSYDATAGEIEIISDESNMKVTVSIANNDKWDLSYSATPLYAYFKDGDTRVDAETYNLSMHITGNGISLASLSYNIPYTGKDLPDEIYIDAGGGDYQLIWKR